MKHKHAELMAQYALDAMEMDEPWLRWQFYSKTFGRWIDCHAVAPSWYEQTEYRRKPQTRTMTIPESAETIVFKAGRSFVMKPRIQEISLRDYFAANALNGLLSFGKLSLHDKTETTNKAYRYADSMLESREGEQ